MKDFIAISEYSHEQLQHILDVAKRLKSQLKSTGQNEHILADKTLAMVFEKPSLRTRVSFSVAMTQLGGDGLLLRDEEVGLGKRELVQDVARVLSGMCDGIMARTFSHQNVRDLAKWSTVPVINGLTDYSHPCQAMTDILTLQEHFGDDLSGKTLAYIGDGNNMARSLAVACAKFKMRFILASPQAHALPADDVARLKRDVLGMNLVETNDPIGAVREADALYTDTWVSMGQENEKADRIATFTGFEINETLLQSAPPHAVVLHCLPAYRGLEISDGVVESNRSLIFPQAENRLHFQKGLLAVLMGGL